MVGALEKLEITEGLWGVRLPGANSTTNQLKPPSETPAFNRRAARVNRVRGASEVKTNAAVVEMESRCSQLGTEHRSTEKYCISRSEGRRW